MEYIKRWLFAAHAEHLIGLGMIGLGFLSFFICGGDITASVVLWLIGGCAIAGHK